MPETDAIAWRQGLPPLFETLVVPPLQYATHVDEDACACKLNGFDADGRRCFVRHGHTAIVDAFDIDELPLAIAVHHVRRTAWRLRSGQWLMTVDRIERLDSCAPRVLNETVVAAGEAQLGL